MAGIGSNSWLFATGGGVTQQNPTLGESANDQLLSAGAGLRCQISDKFHLRADYGVQLKRDYLADPGNLTTQSRGQVDIGVECSY